MFVLTSLLVLITQKTVEEIIASGKELQTTVDIKQKYAEFIKSLPTNIPSVSPIFSDPDNSNPTPSKEKEKEMAKVFENPIPAPITPPLPVSAPLLMKPDNNELSFLIPEIDFCPVFDPTQISAKTIQLLQQAVQGRLDDEDKDELLEILEDDSIIKLFDPKQLKDLIENNQTIAVEILKKVIGGDSEKTYLDILNGLEPTINVINTVKDIVSKSPESFCTFVSHLTDVFSRTKETNKRRIKASVDFFEVFVKLKPEGLDTVKDKIVSFCSAYSNIKEVNSLFKVLKSP